MTPDVLETRVREIVEYGLNLDPDGQMMMPLKEHEIAALERSIRDLVVDAVSEATE